MDQDQQLTEYQPQPPAQRSAFFGLEPEEIAYKASRMASVLKDIIVKQRLSVRIGPNEYVKAEGWETLGAFLAILPLEDRVIEHPNGDFEAYVKLIRQSDGGVVGGASAICSTEEKRWANADRYARRSMAVTRATGKAYRQSFAWIMTMAGYSPTPYEEMPEREESAPRRSAPSKQKNDKSEAVKHEGYDPHNKRHQDWLIKQLTEKKIEEKEWDLVGNALKGRPSSDLALVLEEQNLSIPFQESSASLKD